MRKTTSIELELFKNGDNGIKFYAKQFDDLKLKVKVFDGTEQIDISNQDITVFILKEDKTVIEQKKDIVVEEDNTILIDLSKQATTALGKCSMELILSDEEGNASTSTVSYMVAEKLSASIVEMIKSEDDINALNMIEEFIKTSNVDILEIKEAIQDIRDDILNANENLESTYYELVQALESYKEGVISDINKEADIAVNKVNEVISKVDEAVDKIDESIIKVDEAVNKVDEALEQVYDIEHTVNGAIEEIDTHKEDAILEVDTKKAQSIQAIEDKKSELTTVIETEKNEAILNISNKETEVIGQITTEKDTLITLLDEKMEAINSVDNKVEEGLSTIETKKVKSIELINETTEYGLSDIRNNTETSIRDIEGTSSLETNKVVSAGEVALIQINDKKIASIDEIDNKKEAIIRDIEGTKAGVIEELTDSINNLKEQSIVDLNAVFDEIVASNNEDIEGIKTEINNLKADVESKTTILLEKITESDINIEELSALIEEAKEVAGLVRAFIDSHAVDLSNYYTKEEVYNKNEIDTLIDLSNYYTKEETDSRIEELLKDVEAGNIEVAGVIGESSIPDIFATAPEPTRPDEVVATIKTYDNYDNRYIITYLYSLKYDNKLILTLNSSKMYSFNGVASSGGTENTEAYYCPTKDTRWTAQVVSADYKTKEIELVKRGIFYSSHPFTLLNSDEVLIEASSEENYMSYNEAIKNGIYKVEHTNRVDNSVNDNENGFMVVNNVNKDVIQTLYDKNGKTYTRVRKNNVWSSWNGNIKKIGEIKEVVPTEFYNIGYLTGYHLIRPILDTEYPYRLECFLGTSEKMYKIWYFKNDPSGFVKYNTETKKLTFDDSIMTSDNARGFYVDNYPGNNSSAEMKWTENLTAYNARTVYYNPVYHNFKLVDENGNTVRESSLLDQNNIKGDFNDAVDYESYVVEVLEDSEVLNAPTKSVLNGILTVVKANNKIKQELVTDDNTSYRRIHSTAWSEWKEI